MTIAKKLNQQFGFTADPSKTLLHTPFSAFAHTPTWYYFSHPSQLAFHNFTQHKEPAKTYAHFYALDSSLFQNLVVPIHGKN